MTWEPLENIINDVPDMVEDFVIDRFGISAEQIQSCKYKGETYYIVPKRSPEQTNAAAVAATQSTPQQPSAKPDK